MQLAELSQAMDEFVRSKGWYETGSLRKQTPRNIAISLSLEAAEILEHYQWNENAKDREELSGELADVALYLLQLAKLNDINLEEAIMKKLSMNYKRTWDAEKTGLNNEGSS